MKDRDQTKEELVKEVLELRKENNELIASYERDLTKRKKVEDELRESEAKYKRVSDNSPAVLYQFLMTPEGEWTFPYVSNKVESILGIPAEEIMKDSSKLFGIVHPEDQKMFQEGILKAAESLESFPLTFRFLKDREVIWVEARGMPTPLTDGDILWDGFLLDITERKLTEERLANSEERFRQIAENCQDWIWEVDSNGLYTYVSQTSENLLGYQPEEIIGKKHFYDFFLPEEREELKNAAFEAFKQRQSFREFINHNVNKNGETVIVSTIGIPLLDNHGNLLGYRGADVNITERKKAEEEIKIFRTIADRAEYGSAISDLKGNLTYINDYFARVHGYTSDELNGRNLALFHSEKQMASIHQINKSLIENGSYNPVEIWHTHKDGTEFPMLMSGKVINDESGKPKYLAAIGFDITEQKRLEKDNKESAVFLDIMADALIVLDTQANVIKVNEVFSKMWGYTPDEVYGKPMFDLSPKKERAKHKSEMEKAANSNEISVFETIALTKDKKEISVSVSGTVLKDENGNLQNFIATFRDITERKQIERELDESRQKFIETITNLDSGYYSCTMDGLLLEHNKAFKRIFGFDTNQDMDGVKIPDFWLNPKQRSKYLDILMNKGFVRNYLVGIKIINGEQITVSVNSHLVKDENGKVVRIEGTFTDITEQKQAEDELRESEERYRTLTENIGEGVCFINEEEIFVFANPSAERIFGVGEGELPGLCLTNFLFEENIEIIKNETQKRFQGESSVYEHEIVLKDGSKKNVLITATPSFDDNKFIGTFALFRDITKRKQDEEEIKRKNEELHLLNAEKDKFFSIIAHDLKSPFNSFLGLTQIMAEELPTMTLEQIQKIALTMRKSATNLYGLLEDLLEWSQVKREVTTFEPESLLLMPKISESLALYLEAVKSKKIDISYDISENLTVFADGNMFESIVRNLASNAIKFTPQEGKITITAKSLDDNWIEISVKDAGIGMNQEMVKNLFKLDADTSRKGTNNEPSTGLGLIICKEFVEKHGGKLLVESEEGKGREVPSISHCQQNPAINWTCRRC